MKTFCLAPLWQLAVGVADASFCPVLGTTLPSGCSCGEETLGFKITCSKTIFYETAGVKIVDTTASASYTITPCASPASLSLTLSNSGTPSGTVTQAVTAGATENIPIPGVGSGITGLGTSTCTPMCCSAPIAETDPPTPALTCPPPSQSGSSARSRSAATRAASPSPWTSTCVSRRAATAAVATRCP